MNAEEQRRAEAERRHLIYQATHSAGEVSKVPEDAHFAVLHNKSMRYDDGYGDDRHGPSYSTLNYVEYIFFDNEVALNAWILENYQKETFKVVHVKPVEYELKTTIAIRE